MVFSTGQRLDLKHIFTELKEIIEQHQIIVGLDLAHTVGNRTLMLRDLPVTYAVGCSYKHLCGSAGSGFGIYVNKETDLKNTHRFKDGRLLCQKRFLGLLMAMMSKL